MRFTIIKDPSSVTGRWNKEEHDKFIDAIKRYGKDWKQVEQHIESRTGAQIRSHAQKFFNRIIKKYNIEKNDVIDFVHNAYNSNIDSSIQSPKRKRKPEALTPHVPKLNKANLYVFNEEPDITPGLDDLQYIRKGIKVDDDNESKLLDYSIGTNDDHFGFNKPVYGWREHIKGIYGLTKELLEEVENCRDVETPCKQNYFKFLTSMSNKLEIITANEMVRVGRPHSTSEDNICLSFTYQ